MAGNLVARGIVAGDQTWREFSPFELVWAGGSLARAGVQIRNWVRRYADRMAERRARARELAHIRAREAEKVRQAQEAARREAEAAEAARRAAEAEEAARLAAIASAEEAERHAAEAAERQAAEEEARRAAEAEEAVRRAAEAEEEARRTAEAEEIERLAVAAAIETPLQNEQPAGFEQSLQSEPASELEQPFAVAAEVRDSELITPAEVIPEPAAPVRTGAPKRRSKNRKRRERPQPDRRRSEITSD
jgi:hypothetical protein